jgi:hypothetical protein
MIKNKFNGYSKDGIRLYNDPVTVAAFTAGMSSAGTAAAVAAPTLTAAGLGTATMAGTTLGATGATLGGTAALGAAGTAAAPTLGAAAAAAAPTLGAGTAALSPEIAANLASAGAPAQGGIMQGGAQAIPGAVPPPVPPPAAPLNPAGGDQTIQAFQQAAANPNRGVELGKVAGPTDGSNMGTYADALNKPPNMAEQMTAGQNNAFGNPYGLNNFTDKEIAQKVFERQGAGGVDSLTDGFMKAMEYANKNPLTTASALYTVQNSGILGGKKDDDDDEYGGSADLSKFTASGPSPYLYGAGGGSVSDLPMNTVGGNANYPMSQQRVSAYTRPSIQNPVSQNVIDVSGAGTLDPYTGMPSYSGGGKVSFFEKVMREDEERMAQARRSMNARPLADSDVSGSGVFARTLAQQQGRPDQVAASQYAQAAKRAGVKIIEMPKANMPEDFTHEAAAGGIMRAAGGGRMSPTLAKAFGNQLPALMRSSAYKGPRPVPMARPAPVPMARPAPVAAPAARPPVSAGLARGFGSQLNAFLNSPAYEGNRNRMAEGGVTTGLGGYSDGGRLLRGPGDGVSDSIPAVIGKRQPARLADGEFVIPARIVSELGNGSTEAGARQLYAMMERIQKRRKKSVGKGKVAVNSKSHKDLPA